MTIPPITPERLREYVDDPELRALGYPVTALLAAADEIERLRIVIRYLRDLPLTEAELGIALSDLPATWE
jgi:hypothetical protein